MGKKKRKDAQEFERDLMANIIKLHNDLAVMSYRHDGYEAFNMSDPKPRNIHKASIRDRVLHRALYRILYPFFDRTFISDSYSCRDDKILSLISVIVDSFSVRAGTGLPLGNLTSQLFVNIYMNEFDQFVKHKLKTKYYIRYADDFVILSRDKSWLEELLFRVGDFLEERLKLSLHPDKVFIKTLSSGVDFLGWVHFPDHRVLRTATKRRMIRNIEIKNGNEATVQSYRGLLKHGNTHKIAQKLPTKLS